MFSEVTPIIIREEATDLKIYALGDCHIGSPECDLKALQDFLEDVYQDDNARIIVIGDLMDNGVKTSKTNVYRATCQPQEQQEIVLDLLKPLALQNKILAGVCGNHEDRTKRDVDLDVLYTIFAKLDIEDRYRSEFAFLRIKQGNPKAKTRKTNQVWNFFICHGTTQNKDQNFAYYLEGVDICFFGHTHNPQISIPCHLVFTQRGNVEMKNIPVIICSSWLKAGGYGIKNMYAPKATCVRNGVLIKYHTANCIIKDYSLFVE